MKYVVLSWLHRTVNCAIVDCRNADREYGLEQQVHMTRHVLINFLLYQEVLRLEHLAHVSDDLVDHTYQCEGN